MLRTQTLVNFVMHMIIFDEKEKNFVFVESYESYGESLHGNIYSD